MDRADQELAQALREVRSAHFSGDGAACDYAALAASAQGERLDACLERLDALQPRALAFAAQTAFWLNAYNACVLREAPRLASAQGVTEARGFFLQPRVRIGGHAWSLDDIEHGALRGAPKYASLSAPLPKTDPRQAFVPPTYDERIHFGLYCACRSSPPLRVFDEARLEHQLEEAARDYIRREVRAEQDAAVLVVPKIFQWYADDFGGRAGVLGFVLARLGDEALVERIDARGGTVELRYAPYDWSLNARVT